MKDKLSLEELIGEMDYLISVSRKSKQTSSPIGKHHVPMLKAIRSILIPVPKEKLGELVEFWSDKIADDIVMQKPGCFSMDENILKDMLQAYDRLKEE